MYRDIVLPKNNEAEFIEIAEKLKLRKLYFLYDFDGYNKDKIQKKLSLIDSNVDIKVGFLANQKNASNIIKHSKIIVAKSSLNDRALIEGKKVRLIYGFEEMSKKDYMHQRGSGLNNVLCEFARKNNVAVGFAYSSLFNKNSQIATLLLGRTLQNISLCRKYNVKTMIGSFSSNPFHLRNCHDISSLFTILGMEKGNIKKSLASDI